MRFLNKQREFGKYAESAPSGTAGANARLFAATGDLKGGKYHPGLVTNAILFFLLLVKKIIDLPGGESKTPFSHWEREHSSPLFLPENPSSWFWILEGLLELTRHPSRALNHALFSALLSVLRDTMDIKRCAARVCKSQDLQTLTEYD